MLALADRDGYVMASLPGLAARANISLESCIAGMDKLQSPDPFSFSSDEEGRRVRKTERGWFLINHAKYRRLMSAEEHRERTRQRVAKFRHAQQSHSNALRNDVTLPVTPVTQSNKCNDIAEAEAEAEVKSSGSISSTKDPKGYKGEGFTKSAPPDKSNGKTNHLQADFDERDLRALAKAEHQLADRLKASIGSDNTITERQFFTQACELAGITVKRGLALREIQRKWPS